MYQIPSRIQGSYTIDVSLLNCILLETLRSVKSIVVRSLLVFGLELNMASTAEIILSRGGIDGSPDISSPNN